MSFGKFLGDSDKNKNQAVESSSTGSSFNTTSSAKTTVGAGCKVVGNLEFKDNAEISGQVEGEIKSYSRLFITESAKVKANIVGVDVAIQGDFQGEVNVSGKLSLLKPARIVGNVVCASLSIEDGVSFEGKCTMPKNERKDNLGLKDTRAETTNKMVSAIKAA